MSGKILGWVLLALAVGAVGVAAVSISTNDILISEFAWQNPVDTTRWAEGYVELYNPTPNGVSLGDYYITDKDDFIYNLSGFAIPANGHFLIADFRPNGRTPDYDTNLSPGTNASGQGVVKDLGGNMDEEGDDVFLFKGYPLDVGSVIMDLVAWNRTTTGWEVEPENQDATKLVFTGPDDNVYGSIERKHRTLDSNLASDLKLLNTTQSNANTTADVLVADYDKDALSDWSEQHVYNISADKVDSDCGGRDDGTEIANGGAPLDSSDDNVG